MLAALAAAWNGDVRIPAEDWEDLGFGGAVLTGVLLLVGYLFGGFVAGRLAGAGRVGTIEGLLVFVAGVAIAAGTGLAVSAAADGDQTQRLVEGLWTFGLPGSSEEWGDVASVAGIASLAGMLLGSLAGGRLAEHKLRQVASGRTARWSERPEETRTIDSKNRSESVTVDRQSG